MAKLKKRCHVPIFFFFFILNFSYEEKKKVISGVNSRTKKIKTKIFAFTLLNTRKKI